jgi:acyl-CoA synthetase (AMP-forming)/AMP-acid ligase II
MNLASILDIHARTRPTHPAVIHGSNVLSYADFARQVRQLADVLREEGVQPGNLLGIGLRDSSLHLVALFAAMRIGAVFVPIDWRWTLTETQGLTAHFKVSHLLCEPDAPRFDGPKRIEVNTELQARMDIAEGQSPVVDTPDLPMLLSLSSGTTGRPTGPVLTHAQMMARTENQLAALTFNQHDRYMLVTPLYFGGGRAFALTHLIIGATLVLYPPPYSSEEFVTAIEHHKVNTTFLVPTLIRRLLSLPDTALNSMKGLRLLLSSGAPLHPTERKNIRARLNPGFMEYFASTEGGGISVLSPSDQTLHPDSVGRAAFRVEIEIVNDDHQPVLSGDVGMIRYRGPGVANGFFRDPEKSAEAFRDGWFYPGDLGRMDQAGYLFLLGRQKNVIIRGGVNIYPLEIERVIEGLSDVREAVVLGLSDTAMGEQVWAVVVAEPNVTEASIRAACAERLAPYKIPKIITFLDVLPRNSAGKVLIDQVRIHLENHPGRVGTPIV